MGKKMKPHVSVRTITAAQEQPIIKSEQPENLNRNSGAVWIEPPEDMRGLRAMVEHSTILPQCIRAYKDNIAGFGIGVRYIDDVEETSEMTAEYDRLVGILDLLNVEMDTKEVFEDLIEARETFGVAYLEVLRNIEGEVTQIDCVKEPAHIRKTAPEGEVIETQFFYKGESVTRRKQFCRYKQEVDGKTVFFKEFGDLRCMDIATGSYMEELDIAQQANEILEFAIGTRDYGMVRWIGQVLNVDGGRRAEHLNNNYFLNGRHTPLMIVIKGGTLSDESFAKMENYMNDIKGESGQHSFMVLEVEDTDGKVGFEEDNQPSVEIKDMASILQKDELFQDYLDNSRKKVQSAFRLPDLYVGYTSDFNRATAQTAQEITEQQVFVPERKSLAWAINNKLLNAYAFKHVEVYFKEPDITNPDDVAKLLAITEKAGGLTPNLAKELTLKTLGKTSENYEEEWADIPLVVTAAQTGKTASSVATQLEKSIEKAVPEQDHDVVAIMKAVQRELCKGGLPDGAVSSAIESGNSLYP